MKLLIVLIIFACWQTRRQQRENFKLWKNIAELVGLVEKLEAERDNKG